MPITRALHAILYPLVTCLLVTSFVRASDCNVTSVGFTPIDDLGTGLYLNQFQGGLYPGGSNVVPLGHALAGRARALEVRQAARYVLLSIGMSNTTQEFCSQPGTPPCDAWTFMGQASSHPRVNTGALRIVNGARGGQTVATWDQPTDTNYNRVRDVDLAAQGLTESDVYVLWIKLANPQPNRALPTADAEAYRLMMGIANVLRAAKTRYPNCRIAFLSNRIYAGYAGYPIPTVSMLNPEPYAYEGGFGVKWLIEAQINQMNGGGIDVLAGDMNYTTVVPWVSWGPNLWADGTTPRSDGLLYLCSDLQNDGTHPAMGGEQKVGALLLAHMLNSPFATPWFRRCEPGDMNGDGQLNGDDIRLFVTTLLDPSAAAPPAQCAADCDDNLSVGMGDISAFVNRLLNWPY